MQPKTKPSLRRGAGRSILGEASSDDDFYKYEMMMFSSRIYTIVRRRMIMFVVRVGEGPRDKNKRQQRQRETGRKGERAREPESQGETFLIAGGLCSEIAMRKARGRNIEENICA